MELKDQVCSLELAKKLKELGVEQDSFLYWAKGYHHEVFAIEMERFSNLHEEGISAFTVAELGEILPSGVRTIKTRGNKGKWIALKWIKDKKVNFNADTEADARAKMLIYLLENNY
jgi:hypothetical protein